jgi:hypothetical protein
VTATDFEHAAGARHFGVDNGNGTRAKSAPDVQSIAPRRVIEQRKHLVTEGAFHRRSAPGRREIAEGAESETVALDRLAHAR